MLDSRLELPSLSVLKPNTNAYITKSYAADKYLTQPSQTSIIRNKIGWLHADSQIVNNNCATNWLRQCEIKSLTEF